MTTRRDNLVFAAIVGAYFVFLATVFWNSSRVIAGERFFGLGDDALISMRYARNFADGHGLVWNAGERAVEGYTNLLWVFVMAAVHLLPLAVSKTSAVVQVLSLSLLVANLFVTRNLARAIGAGAAGSIGAALLTALYYPLNAWSMQGSELALLVPVIGLAVLLAIRGVAAERFSSVPFWLLGAATLVRLDAGVVYLGLLAGLTAVDRSRRRAHLAHGIGVLLLFTAAQTAFRLGYYGEWLPNTYYLKMTGYPAIWRIAWGIRDFAGFVWHHIGIAVAFAAIGLYRYRRPGAIVAAAALAQFGYAAYIGPADNRFTTLAMPLVFALAAPGVEVVVAAAAARGWISTRREAIYASLALAAVGAWMFNAEALRFRRFSDDVLARDRLIERLTTPEASVAVSAAGTLYYLDRPGVDVLGKNDYTLARERVHRSFRAFRAGYVSGHMKWDYAYSIGTLAPDVVAELWRYPEDAAPYLQEYEPLQFRDETLYLRRGSRRIRWDRLPSLQASASQR